MSLLRAFLSDRGRVVLLIQLAAVVMATAVATWWVQRPSAGTSPMERAQTLQRSGQLGPAERIFWEELTRGPVTVPLLIAFLDNHHAQRVLSDQGFVARGEQFAVADADLEAFFARPDVPRDVVLFGRFWRAVLQRRVTPELRAEMVALAAYEPPAPYANRILGLEARREGRLVEAAARLEREGMSFPERAEDFALAMRILAMADAWEEIETRIADPARRDRIPPQIRYAYAVKYSDMGLAVRAIVDTTLEPRPRAPLALAAVSATMWLLFAFRMGRAMERPRLRIPLFAAAFALGVISVFPTLIVVGIEESLGFRERGELVSDLIFFTVGVGLREEVCKLLLFLPLLPILRRYGTRLDVLTCGALVGLGFAAEENVQYLQAGLSTALSRFLTANFLHMALSALLALATFDFVRDPERSAPAFSRTLLVVVAMHGAYDFFLSNGQVEGLSFLAMTTFILLTRMFMSELRLATKGPSVALLPRFVQAVVVVSAASFVYATALAGPTGAALAIAQGLFGMVLIVVMFVQEIRRA